MPTARSVLVGGNWLAASVITAVVTPSAALKLSVPIGATVSMGENAFRPRPSG